MKPLKILGLAAVAVAALIALVGAGTASATVLCKNNASTSACSETYASGQSIEASLSETATLETTGGTVLDTCTGSTLKAKTTNAGGASETVKANIETLSWSGCTKATTTLKVGTLEIHWISGTDNGTLTAGGTEWTVNTIFGTCTYGFGTSTDLGTVTGGNPAKISISAIVTKTAGACPTEARWTASYTLTAPKPLYLASAGSGGATATTLTTSLSGEEKSGEELTVNEGSKVKDTATLSGTNASKATGTVKYKVYADKECKELVTSAGEVTVTGGSVPASEEKELEAGRVYYWQAEYSGDSNNLASTSTCGKEVLTVKAEVLLSTTLSAEEEEESIEGEEITAIEGTAVKDKATLGGTNVSKATGTVNYTVYSDEECEEAVAEAGEVSVVAGEASSSEGVELEAGTYYWQAEYSGDALHQAAKDACGLEVLSVAKFEGPSWRSVGVRMPNGEEIAAVGEPVGGLSFAIGESTVACLKGISISPVFGSFPRRAGKMHIGVGLTNCAVLTWKNCVVNGYGANEIPLPAGEALMELDGELVWRGNEKKREIPGVLARGSLTFEMKKEVITTLRFKETAKEGCPIELRDPENPKEEKVLSITGSAFAELWKERNPEKEPEKYEPLKPEEEVQTLGILFSNSTPEVERWQAVTRTYQKLKPKAEAGTENATLDAFLREEMAKKVGVLIG